MDKKIIIIGYGIVGKLEYENMKNINPDIYDLYIPEYCTKKDIVYDVAFVAVPTDNNENGLCDITEVENAINEIDAKIYVMKSTVLPGTCKKLSEKTGKHIIFSPEYSGSTQHAKSFNYNFTILGGDKQDCCEVIQILQNVYNAEHQFKITDSTTAETVKYMFNSFLATKVSFCNQFFELCEQLGISYEELRELFILDPRISAAHTFVYRDSPYWDSHCFNKDIPAIAETFDMKLLKDIYSFNESQKDKYNK